VAVWFRRLSWRANSISVSSRLCASWAIIPDDSNPLQAKETEVIKPPAGVGDGEGWLVIDDLVDTGRTAEVLAQTDAESAFRDCLRQAAGTAAHRHLRYRSEPGHLDLLPWDVELQFMQPIATRRKE